MKHPADKKHKNGSSLMRNALKLCQRMAENAVEFRLIVRLPLLVDEYTHAYKALRDPAGVRILLDIDEELLDHAYMQLPHIIPAAIDEAAKTFDGELDRFGWQQVLELALEVDDRPGNNVVSLDAYRKCAS